MKKQAIIYTRFSPRPDADTSKSCEKQEERCQAYCLKMGYEIYAIYHDKDVTGKIIARQDLQLALDALAPGMVLVVDTGDRLARDMLVELTIAAQVEAAECAIEYADGSSTRTTKEGRLFRNILSAFSQYERERIAENTKRGLKKKRDNGEWQGKPPVGYYYDKKKKKLIESPQEQACIDFIKRMSLMHYKQSTEIAEMTTKLHGLCRGKPWSARTVRKILAAK